jgi:hypothetical protein
MWSIALIGIRAGPRKLLALGLNACGWPSISSLIWRF